MDHHARFQHIGDRTHQCDATATAWNRGRRAYVLLDGIGDRPEVREWTRGAARRLARAAAYHGDAETALLRQYQGYADHRSEYSHDPGAAAVVAVHGPDDLLTLAWCGDSRAYLQHEDGRVVRLTRDHRMRRYSPSGSRNLITSWLGSPYSTEQVEAELGHEGIETVTLRSAGRLALLSDGAYEPHEEASTRWGELLAGSPARAARQLATGAVCSSRAAARSAGRTPRADNATALVADLAH